MKNGQPSTRIIGGNLYDWNEITQGYDKREVMDSKLDTSIPKRPQALDKENAREIPSLGSSKPSHRITITMYRCGKLLDTDNKWIAPKALLDGLIAAFELPGDSESQIDYRVEQIRVKTRKEIGTEILIEDIL